MAKYEIRAGHALLWQPLKPGKEILTETENAQNALQWILMSTFFLQTTNVTFLDATASPSSYPCQSVGE